MVLLPFNEIIKVGGDRLIQQFYKKKMKASIVSFSIVFSLAILVYVVNLPVYKEAVFQAGSIGIFSCVFLVSYFHAKKQLQRFSAITNVPPRQPLLHMTSLIYQRMLLQFWLFDEQGTYVGMIQPSKMSLFARLLFFISEGTFLSFYPVTFVMYDEQQKIVGSFTKKRACVTVYNAKNQLIGRHKQHQWKSLVHITGFLEDAAGNKLFETNVQGSSGSFTINDTDGRFWASYYQGKMPVSLQQHFNEYQLPYISFGGDLTEDEKIIIIALTSIWMLL